jgi:hypothetical protein
MGYANRYGDAVLLGLAIADAARQITEFRAGKAWKTVER